MTFAVTEAHAQLADVVRSFARKVDVLGIARAAADGDDVFPSAVWDQIAGGEWVGLHVAADRGGSGYGRQETAVVAYELGAQVMPAAFLASVVAAGVVDGSTASARRDDVLRAMASGTTLVGVGLGRGVATGPTGRHAGECLVVAGRWAERFMLACDGDALVVRRDAAGVSVTPHEGLDPSLGVVRVQLTDVSLDADDDLLPEAGPAMRRLFQVFAAAGAAGGARSVLDLALAHAKTREQFGRPIGSFQAVKHRLATMLVEAEAAAALAWGAARGDDEAGTRLSVCLAAIGCLSAYQRNAQAAIQVLGAVGFTWEHDLHLHLRRAVALAQILVDAGDPAAEAHLLVQDGVRPRYAVDLPPSAEAFREEARRFRARLDGLDPEGVKELLVESGYLVPHWPRPYGRAAGPVEQLVLEEEFAGVEIPSLGVAAWVLPTLIQCATPEQVARWVPRSLEKGLRWCQLFSEPGAGSDAAAVRLRGVRVAGGWSLTGQKTWTSGADLADHGLATVRTGPLEPKHRGITAMVVHMRSRGVTVRPIKEMSGDSLFCEVFFDDVFVSEDDVVGEEGEGWTVARSTLSNERVTIGGSSEENLSPFELVTAMATGTTSVLGAERQLVDAIVVHHALKLVNIRAITRSIEALGPGPEGSVTKLLTSELAQTVSELAMRVAAEGVLRDREGRFLWHFLYARCLTIAGGTAEITRNVIAERILGLPREPLAYRT